MAGPMELGAFGDIITDSYFIVDRDLNIVDFNRAFHMLLPRQVARNVQSSKCYDVLQLEICRERCIARQCWDARTNVSLSEICGRIAGEQEERRFILSAVPLFDDEGELIGAMEIQRDVTVEAVVQDKYQQQMESFNLHQALLKETLGVRARQLFDLNRRLDELERRLLRIKTDRCD